MNCRSHHAERICAHRDSVPIPPTPITTAFTSGQLDSVIRPGLPEFLLLIQHECVYSAGQRQQQRKSVIRNLRTLHDLIIRRARCCCRADRCRRTNAEHVPRPRSSPAPISGSFRAHLFRLDFADEGVGVADLLHYAIGHYRKSAARSGTRCRAAAEAPDRRSNDNLLRLREGRASTRKDKDQMTHSALQGDFYGVTTGPSQRM